MVHNKSFTLFILSTGMSGRLWYIIKVLLYLAAALLLDSDSKLTITWYIKQRYQV